MSNEPQNGTASDTPPERRSRGKDYRAIARELFDTLKRISKEYMTPEQIRRALERHNDVMYGLGYDEALEMAYENIQAEATDAIKGMRRP